MLKKKQAKSDPTAFYKSFMAEYPTGSGEGFKRKEREAKIFFTRLLKCATLLEFLTSVPFLMDVLLENVAI